MKILTEYHLKLITNKTNKKQIIIKLTEPVRLTEDKLILIRCKSNYNGKAMKYLVMWMLHLIWVFKLPHHTIHSHVLLLIFLSLTYQSTCLKNRSLFSYTSMHTTTWILLFTTQTFSSIIITFSENLILFFKFAGGRNISNQTIIVNSIMHNKKDALFSIVMCRSVIYCECRSVKL